ncbi:hypothetical protein AMTR_s05646p00001910, partial [Amborella trichopoda]
MAGQRNNDLELDVHAELPSHQRSISCHYLTSSRCQRGRCTLGEKILSPISSILRCKWIYKEYEGTYVAESSPPLCRKPHSN